MDYKLVVIGSGPAGWKASTTATSLGGRVAVVDRQSMFGGVCLRTGGVPSKALRETVLYLTGLQQRTFYGEDYAVKHEISRDDLRFRVEKVVRREVESLQRRMAQHRVEYLPGLARFVDANTLEIEGEDGTKRVTAEFILVACGTRPAQHPAIPNDAQRVVDTDSLLGATVEGVAERFLVVGAGPIGMEYASIASPLCKQTTVVDAREELLPRVDREIVAALRAHLERNQVVFELGETVRNVVVDGNQVCATLESGKRIEADRLLYAGRRQPNTDTLNLDAIGLPVNDKGRLLVNEHFQTEISNIYAAGDVIGFPCLASTAVEQGRVAASHMFGRPASYDPHLLPFGIYTIPEICVVGRTERQLQEEETPYEVGRARFEDLAKGQLIGDRTGFLKLVFDPESLKLLGVHAIGDTAAEILHIGHMAMMLGGDMKFLRDTVFNFPTMAEAYKVAAEDGLSKLSSR